MLLSEKYIFSYNGLDTFTLLHVLVRSHNLAWHRFLGSVLYVSLCNTFAGGKKTCSVSIEPVALRQTMLAHPISIAAKGVLQSWSSLSLAGSVSECWVLQRAVGAPQDARDGVTLHHLLGELSAESLCVVMLFCVRPRWCHVSRRVCSSS